MTKCQITHSEPSFFWAHGCLWPQASYLLGNWFVIQAVDELACTKNWQFSPSLKHQMDSSVTLLNKFTSELSSLHDSQTEKIDGLSENI